MRKQTNLECWGSDESWDLWREESEGGRKKNTRSINGGSSGSDWGQTVSANKLLSQLECGALRLVPFRLKVHINLVFNIVCCDTTCYFRSLTGASMCKYLDLGQTSAGKAEPVSTSIN